MEREASPWGLESRDVQSPDEMGSPEGSLKGEGGTAPPKNVHGEREKVVYGRESGLGAWTLRTWGLGVRIGSPGSDERRWGFQHLLKGQRSCVGSRERFAATKSSNDLPGSHKMWVFCNSLILQATPVRMRKRKFLSKKAVGTMKLKRYLLGLNPKALGLSHKAQSLNPKVPGLSLKAQGLSPKALGLCPQVLSLHPEALNRILRARSLNPRALGMNPKALAMIPRALGTNPGALGMNLKVLDMNPRAQNLSLKAPGMNPRVRGMNPRTLKMNLRIPSSKPKALNLKLRVPNSREVLRCF